MMTINEFVTANQITASVVKTDVNPLATEWKDADHWKVTLRLGRKRLSTYFSMGKGHKGRRPEVDEVLDCLAMDAQSVDNSGGFEDWASDLGYDADSRKAEKAYKQVAKEAKRLLAWLGEDHYTKLLDDVERL